MGAVYEAEQLEPIRRRWRSRSSPRHGHRRGHRPLRSRAPGAGGDGPPQHRQGARRRHHRRRAGPTSSWSSSRACRSPSTATSTSLDLRERLELFIAGLPRPSSTPTRRASSTATSSRATSWSRVADGKPVPKVIDFGIAKATEQRSHRHDALHRARRQMVGTPALHEPRAGRGERARHRYPGRHLQPRRRALRAGHRRAAVRHAGHHARRLHRQVRAGRSRRADAKQPRRDARGEMRPPRRPSIGRRRRWGFVGRCVATSTGSCSRRSSAIASRRYETANALASDIERHLENKPVIARPPTLGYTAAKFIRRHRLAVTDGGGRAWR